MANSGTVTVTRTQRAAYETVKLAWTCASGAATCEQDSIELAGEVLVSMFEYGSTAPTNNVTDFQFLDESTTGLENIAGSINGAVFNNVTTTGTQVGAWNAAKRVVFNGVYTFKVNDNAVNDASGTVTLILGKGGG